jgi:hypothetical protein
VFCSLCFHGFLFLHSCILSILLLIFFCIYKEQFEAEILVLIFIPLLLLFWFAHHFASSLKIYFNNLIDFRFGKANGACCKDSIFVRNTWQIYCHLTVIEVVD